MSVTSVGWSATVRPALVISGLKSTGGLPGVILGSVGEQCRTSAVPYLPSLAGITMNRRSRVEVPLALVVGLGLVAVGSANDEGKAAEFFEAKIRPALVRHCYECHSTESETVQGGLLLDSRSALLRGGESGPAVIPGDADASLLLQALRYDGLEMPPSGRLPERVAANFEAWIKAGASDPRADTAAEVSAEEDPTFTRDFWAFRLPRRALPPSPKLPGWVSRPIDAFVLARQHESGMSPSPPADRRTLIRRVTFDLIGLPPTVAEIDAFLADESPDAYEKLVDRLLASPHYGERWARLWLDLARYAEDQAHIVGNDRSLVYPNAYLYRDWVIGALNADMGYARFVTLQLAADLVEGVEPADHVALGFLGLGPKYYQRKAPEVMADEWEDRVDTVSRGLLGLTVACARCHDHKYDPIPTEDYYALAGVFASTDMYNQPLDKECEKTESGESKDPTRAMHVIREGKTHDLHVMIRGDVNNKGPLVPRRFLAVLSDGDPEPFSRGSGRIELATSIASSENPLTARVLVNRVWAMHFGGPLVGTTSNFGKLGDRPTHPRLFDDLAVRFMESGWSIKWLQREIVLSAAYRQASDSVVAYQAVDPANRLIWRANRKRLDVEQLRDALLSASGRLAHAIGGPSIVPQDPDERRRTVYSQVSRLELDRLLALFDFPDPNAHSARRVQTTTPLQKLFVLNSSFVVQQADSLADELLALARDDRGRIEVAYRSVFARRPNEVETSLGLEFLGEATKPSERLELWRQYAQILVSSNEFTIID